MGLDENHQDPVQVHLSVPGSLSENLGRGSKWRLALGCIEAPAVPPVQR